jgi:hypothetical protein
MLHSAARMECTVLEDPFILFWWLSLSPRQLEMYWKCCNRDDINEIMRIGYYVT